MIVDARAFDDDYAAELVHRDSEIDHLVSLLEPVAIGGIPNHVLVTGPSGVGKSSTTQHVLDELDASAMGVQVASANAISHSSPTGLLQALLHDLGTGYDLNTHASTSAYLERIREFDDSLVLAIDEIDVLDDKTILTALYELPDVYLLGICVSQDHLMCDLDIRVEDRLRSFKHVTFNHYSQRELVDIVRSRTQVAFVDQQAAITTDAEREIADLASGNARYAITLLREAASHCQHETSWPIDHGVIQAVVDDAEQEVATRYVDKLGTHQRALYELIRDHGEIQAGDLHNAYEQAVTDPKSKPQRRNYLQALQREDLIKKEGSTKDTRYMYAGP